LRLAASARDILNLWSRVINLGGLVLSSLGIVEAFRRVLLFRVDHFNWIPFT